jgi:acetyl-CoA carboxylase biotin carboxyl carrier protein
MNSQEIKDFLKSIRDTDIEEMKYQSDGNSLYFKKADVEPVVSVVKEVVAKKSEETKKSTLIAIKSSMVGTFSDNQNSDQSPLIKEGDRVVEGQKVGQIEAMKIIKDVHSKIKGKVIKVLVANGQSVEYGQELFLVDTSK